MVQEQPHCFSVHQKQQCQNYATVPVSDFFTIGSLRDVRDFKDFKDFKDIKDIRGRGSAEHKRSSA